MISNGSVAIIAWLPATAPRIDANEESVDPRLAWQLRITECRDENLGPAVTMDAETTRIGRGRWSVGIGSFGLLENLVPIVDICIDSTGTVDHILDRLVDEARADFDDGNQGTFHSNLIFRDPRRPPHLMSQP